MHFNEELWGKELSRSLKQGAKSKTALRAIEYVKSGMVVEIALEEDGLIVANVLGSEDEPYEAVLERDFNGMYAYCTCPMQATCKHLYATTLVLMAEGARRNQQWALDAQESMPNAWKRSHYRPDKRLQEQLNAVFGEERLPKTEQDHEVSRENWWRAFIQAEAANDRMSIMQKAAKFYFGSTNSSWFVRDRLLVLASLRNPIEGLSKFRETIELLARGLSRSVPYSEQQLEDFLVSKEAKSISRGYEIQMAEASLVSWLSTGTGTEEGITAHVEMQWLLRKSPQSTLSTLSFRLLLTTGKVVESPRHAQAIEQLRNEVERGKRSLNRTERRLVNWLASSPELQEVRYSSYAIRHNDPTHLPVFDVLSWMNLWGESGLLKWTDNTPVVLEPRPARLTIGESADGLVWTVQFPHDTTAGRRLQDVEVFVEASRQSGYGYGYGYSSHQQKVADPKPYIRDGSTIYRLDIGDMPLNVLDAAGKMEYLPIESIRASGTGAALIQRVLAADDSARLVREIPVRPTVELRYDDGHISVSAQAQAIEGEEAYQRTHDGRWIPRTRVDSETDLDTLTSPDVDETHEEIAPKESAVHVLANVPRRADVESLETWLAALVAPAAKSALLNDGQPIVTWKVKSTDVPRLIAIWGERPGHVTYLGNQAFQKLISTLHPPRFNIRLESSGVDWLTVSVEMEGEISGLSMAEIAKALDTGRGDLVALPGGRVYRRDELDDFRRRMEALSEVGLEPGAANQRLHAMQLAGDAVEALEDLGSSDARLRELSDRARQVAEAFSGVPEAPLTTQMAAFLRSYQRTGVDFLVWAAKSMGGALLADDMGLGKTLQTLAALCSLRSQEASTGPSLVVCPASVAHNWQREAARFAPELRVVVLESGNRRKAILEHLDKYDLVIKNYALTRRDADILRNIDWFMICIDEAQAIKNPQAEITSVVKSLKARYRFALTGTPVENRLTDLWSIVDFVVPGYLSALRRFEERVKNIEPAIMNRTLRSRLRPVLMRRLKADVAPELPPRIEERRDCTMTASQRKVYLAEVQRTRLLLNAAKGKNVVGKDRIQILAALTRLRQICCDPGLLDLRAEGSGKVNELVELLPPLLEGGHKVLVFSQFVRMLKRLDATLRRRGILTRMLTGETTKRQELVDGFEADNTPSVFLISLKAGGTGLNLVSATHVVLFDPWWNPAVEAQAIDRTHRIGQDKTVVAFRLITLGTVEEKIAELQERKREMVAQLLEEESFNRSLTREDFEYLLSGDSL